MTATVLGAAYIPDPGALGQMQLGGITGLQFLIDAAAEKCAFIFQVPKDGNLARVGFKLSTVNTADTLKVSFQDVSLTTGDPDGVVDQFRAVASGTVITNAWIRTGLITSDGTDGGVKRAVTRGQILACVVEFNAFVAGSVNIFHKNVATARVDPGGISYVDHFTAAWAKQNSAIGIIAIEYDDGTFAYVPNTFPITTQASATYNSGSTPDETALKFRLQQAVSVGGFWVVVSPTGDFDVVLYGSDGTTPLATTSIDKDVNSAAATLGTLVGLFPSVVVELAANTFYRLSIKPTTVTSISNATITVDTTVGAPQFDQMSGGQDFHYSERTDAGAWSDTTTKRLAAGIVLAGAGGTGGGMSRARIVNAGGV